MSENNNLWVRLIKDKYLRKTSFLQYKSSTNDSWIWKNILKQRELLDKGLRWKLGNGTSIRFWTDRWMSEKIIMEWLQINNTHVHDLNFRVSECFTTNKEWDLTRLKMLVPDHIVERIVAIPIPFHDIEDEICWAIESNGKFSVKSATWLAHGITQIEEPWEFKWIWKLNVAPKLKNFLWQILNGGLQVRENLHYKCSGISRNCPLCDAPKEDVDHLLINCPLTRSFWLNKQTV